MNRAKRRQIGKLAKKTGKQMEHLFVEQNLEVHIKNILHKIDIGSELNEFETKLLLHISCVYIYRRKSRSFIISEIKYPAEIVDAYFKLINPIMEEDRPLAKKIIAYWDKIGPFKIKDIDMEEKTQSERYDEMFSDSESKAKLVLDNLPDFDVKSLKDDPPEAKDNLFFAFIFDMITYLFNPNKFNNLPNYVSFLEKLINSKHPKIEEILKHIEFESQEYQKKYNNPIVLNEDKINFLPEQMKKNKYKHVAEKR